jgi:hypothetical protein
MLWQRSAFREGSIAGETAVAAGKMITEPLAAQTFDRTVAKLSCRAA